MVQSTRAERCVCRRTVCVPEEVLAALDSRDLRAVTRLLLSLALSRTLAMLTLALALTRALILASP